MSTVNAFVTQNASSVAVDKDVAARFCGSVKKEIHFSFEKGAESDGSIWRVGRISPMAKIKRISLACDAIAGLTDLDIGLYKPLEVGGAVISKDCFKDGLDPHAGMALTEEYLVAVADVGKEAYLIGSIAAADADRYGAFDIALTGNTAGTNTGTISGVIEYVE